MSLEAYGDRLEVHPTENFMYRYEYYVLTDKPKPVHIMTDSESSLSFGNFWCPKNAIIFKGSVILF